MVKLPFSAGYLEFNCRGCKKLQKIWLRPALIHSQTGQIETCNCGRWYAITDTAVLEIEQPEMAPIDAEGKPYGQNKPG